MIDINPRPDDQTAPDSESMGGPSHASRVRFIVWLVASVGFLSYLAFGSVEARMWNFGRLFFQDRSIVHVWAYFGDRLPDMPASPLIPVLYYLSLGVMVLGTVWGLWYFLMSQEDSDTSQSHTKVNSPVPPAPTQHHG